LCSTEYMYLFSILSQTTHILKKSVLCMTELWVVYLKIREMHAVGLQVGRSRVRFPMCHWELSLAYSFRPHCGSSVESPSNRNVYQKCFLGYTWPMRKADKFIAITCQLSGNLDPQITGILRPCPKQFTDCIKFYISVRLYRKLQLSVLVKDFPFFTG
jgi:hypothetical protein